VIGLAIIGLSSLLPIDRDEVRRQTLQGLTREQGFPVVTFEGPNGRSVRLQLRPRGAEPQPLARTEALDLVWLAPEEPPHDDEPERKLLRLLVELVRRNEGRARP